MYPNVPRHLALNAIRQALTLFTNFNSLRINIFLQLIDHCWKNVILQFENHFYKQTTGIITGDNHSVSIANITFHSILLPIAKTIKQSQLFKRFIYDIIWLSIGKTTTQDIQKALNNVFESACLKLDFRHICTHLQIPGHLEFLDVDHVINNNCNCGFFTKDFIKPTALNRSFLHGSSYHTPHIFKSIVFSEAIRMRRLNETQISYIESLKRLQIKCLLSNFNKKMVDDMINIAKTWLNRFKPDNTKTKDKNPQFHKIVWATSFTNYINLTDKEKHLNPLSTVIYKRPATLQNLLINHKNIFLKLQPTNHKNGSSSACGHCALCGNHGTHKNMVQNTNFIKSKNGKIIQLKQNLNCTNFGLYAAYCNICPEIYIGQTINRFSVRWNTHRHIWNNSTLNSEKVALSIHYHKNHTDFSYKNKPISECYTVTTTFKFLFRHL